jgi:hypothetical protein
VAEAYINLTEGSGKKAHAWDRTIGANTVLDEFTLPGEYPLASYRVVAESISIATANDHIAQLMAGSSLNVRVRRIRIEQGANAATAGVKSFQVLRLTSAGTGGTSITPAKLDTADAASGASAMSLPSAKGTESTLVDSMFLAVRQAVGTTTAQVDDYWEWSQHPGQKPLIIAAGTSNGICVKNINATTSGTVNVIIEFVETSFV